MHKSRDAGMRRAVAARQTHGMGADFTWPIAAYGLCHPPHMDACALVLTYKISASPPITSMVDS